MPREIEREIGRDTGTEGARRSAQCSAGEGQRAAGRGRRLKRRSGCPVGFNFHGNVFSDSSFFVLGYITKSTVLESKFLW